ncbi:hypothetical protein B9Z55_010847 [Caenorhabditis nigoni]|nr:hypothetical protein B9Z55_010847 [Caenorhabditis nigoni]
MHSSLYLLIFSNFVTVPSELNKQLIDDVNTEVKTTGKCAIWALVSLVSDRFRSGEWNPSNRDEPIISTVAPPAPQQYVNPPSVAPGSIAPPGSGAPQQQQHQQPPPSVMQPGSMMGPQSVNAHQYGMHRQMGGPPSMQMNPSSVGPPPGSVGMPGSVGPGSMMNPGSHQQQYMNREALDRAVLVDQEVLTQDPSAIPQWGPGGQQYHHHMQYPPSNLCF